MEAVAPRCTVCKGNDEWRLQMRDCGHTVCAACGLSLLKQSVKLGKARVKCPKRKCTARIHPNDVDALLDEHNRVLLHHITAEDLIWLREENMKNVMTYALGGASRIRRCPNCHEMYGQRPGCNYVRCADSRCQTKFCWTCGKEQTSWQHFGNNEMCRVGWDDIWQGTWLFRCLLTTNPCCLICISPIVWLLFFICIPLYVWFSFPYYTGRRLLRWMREKSCNEKVAIAIIVLITPLFLAIGMVLALLSMFWVLGLWYAFAVLTLCKCIPIVNKAFDLLDLLQCFAGLVGLDEWRKIIRDSKEQRELMHIDKDHRNAERNERFL